jgi:hypothetical protein
MEPLLLGASAPWFGGDLEGLGVTGVETMRKLRSSRKRGQGLVEYGLIICGVALISAVAISEFGHKTSDLISAVAVVLPGAHLGDNGPIVSGHLIEATANASGDITLDVDGIVAGNNTSRMGANLFGTGNAGSGNGLGDSGNTGTTNSLVVESK